MPKAWANNTFFSPPKTTIRRMPPSSSNNPRTYALAAVPSISPSSPATISMPLPVSTWSEYSCNPSSSLSTTSSASPPSPAATNESPRVAVFSNAYVPSAHPPSGATTGIPAAVLVSPVTTIGVPSSDAWMASPAARFNAASRVPAAMVRATFASPEVVITAFDCSTGVVRCRVTPGEGNTIDADLRKGVVRLDGVESLVSLTELPDIAATVDTDGYLDAATLGEFNVNAVIDFGTIGFFRIAITTEP